MNESQRRDMELARSYTIENMLKERDEARKLAEEWREWANGGAWAFNKPSQEFPWEVEK